MQPWEDPTWPICSVHQQRHEPDPRMTNANGTVQYAPVRHWCDTTRQYLLDGEDGIGLQPGDRAVVPISPAFDLYAEVCLDTEVIADMVRLFFVKTTYSFSIDEEQISLGLHSLGEGRRVIAETLGAYIEGQPIVTCSYHGHNFGQEMELQQGKDNPGYQAAVRGCLALFDKCYPCWKSENIASPGTGSDFGMGEVTPDNSPASQALQQLRGNRGN